MAFADYGAIPLTGLQEASLTPDRGYTESFTDEFGKGIIRGFLNVGEGLVGTTEWLIPGKQESLLQAKERIEQAGTSFAPQIDNPAAWTGRVIGEALPYMGSAMIGGMGAGGVAGGLGAAARGIGIAQKLGAASIAFSVEGQQAYDDAIASGASNNEATAERLIIGSINAAIEAAQIDKLLKFHKSGGITLRSFIKNIRNKAWDLVGGDAKKFTGDVLRHALIEGIEEVAQEGTSISVPAFLRGDIKRNPDGTTDWGYVVDRLAQAGLGGAVAGGVLGGAGAVVGAFPEIGGPSAEQFDATIENIRNAPLKSSKKQKGRFTQQEKDYWISVLEEQKVKTLGDEITLDGWTNTETGRSLSLPAFRAERISPITEEPQAADAGFYGEGTYYSANKEGAARYGELKEYKIELTNPFVVNTPSQIYSFIEKLSGPEYAVKENQIARPEVSREISRKLKEQGYNGIVIKSPYKAESPEIVVFDKGKTVSKSINVYKTTTGSRAGITEEEVSYNKETGDYTDKITGDPVILDQEASRGSLTETQALNRNYDNALVKAVNDIDTSLREEHIKKIRRETGKAFTNFNEILRTAEGNPRARFALAMQALKGTKSLIYDPVKFDENQIEYYYGRAATAPITSGEKLDVVDGLNRLFGLVQNHKGEGLLPMPHQIKSMEKVFGPEMRKALEKLRGGKKKMIRKIIDALNLPRAVLASFDVSAGGRQGLLLLPIARGKWFKAVGQGYRAWTSPEYADYIDLQIKTHPMYKKFIDNGGHLSQIGSLTGGEEIFISEFAHKIPGIRASERAYTTTLNSLRFYTFAKYAQQWQGTGKTANDYRTLAKFINHATGRGDIKGLEEYAPALNAAFFAPRLFMGRIQSLTDIFTSKSSETRKIIAYDLLTFFMGGAGILGLLSLIKGVDVEDDPRSSDFGKIRFGNTRIDFWGGYSQIARLVARTIKSETKGTDSKRIMKEDRGNILWRFIQTKLSPAAGLGVDLMRGETFLGETLEATPGGIAKQVHERFTPLFFQDVIDAIQYQGIGAASIVAPLAMHGIGAMTYPIRPGSQAMRMKDGAARTIFGKEWDNVGPLGQQLIMERHPEIGMLEQKAKLERENYSTVAKRLEEQSKVMNKIIDDLPTKISSEISRTNAYIPGLSRYVSNGWYLNNKKYKQYQNLTTKMMTMVFARIMSHKNWKHIEPELQAVIIEESSRRIKEIARTKIINDTTINDIQKLKNK